MVAIVGTYTVSHRWENLVGSQSYLRAVGYDGVYTHLVVVSSSMGTPLPNLSIDAYCHRQFRLWLPLFFCPPLRTTLQVHNYQQTSPWICYRGWWVLSSHQQPPKAIGPEAEGLEVSVHTVHKTVSFQCGGQRWYRWNGTMLPKMDGHVVPV